jgi:hypothetical protein
MDCKEETGRYSLLRDAVMQQFDPPHHVKFANFMSTPVLQPGQRPTEVLHNLLRWIPKGVDRDHWLVRQVFLDKLPSFMRNHFYDDLNSSLQDIAAKADTMHRERGSSSLPPFENARVMMARSAGPCRIHAKYGSKANRCAEPTQCSWSVKNQGN